MPWFSRPADNPSPSSSAAAEARADIRAMTDVVKALGRADSSEAAVRAALDVVRRSFGWAYGSHWQLDPTDRVLRFAQESGEVNSEFKQVTGAASFAEGVGLSGRAWRARDLVFVPDLAEVTDCVRAPAARRAGA